MCVRCSLRWAGFKALGQEARPVCWPNHNCSIVDVVELKFCNRIFAMKPAAMLLFTSRTPWCMDVWKEKKPVPLKANGRFFQTWTSTKANRFNWEKVFSDYIKIIHCGEIHRINVKSFIIFTIRNWRLIPNCINHNYDRLFETFFIQVREITWFDLSNSYPIRSTANDQENCSHNHSIAIVRVLYNTLNII